MRSMKAKVALNTAAFLGMIPGMLVVGMGFERLGIVIFGMVAILLSVSFLLPSGHSYPSKDKGATS